MLADRIATAQVERGEGVYLAFYHWQVYCLTTGGDVLLEEGRRR